MANWHKQFNTLVNIDWNCKITDNYSKHLGRDVYPRLEEFIPKELMPLRRIQYSMFYGEYLCKYGLGEILIEIANEEFNNIPIDNLKMNLLVSKYIELESKWRREHPNYCKRSSERDR